MIRITSVQQAISLGDRVPAIVLTRMKQLEGNDGVYDPEIFGYLIWLEAGDDLTNIPDVAEGGLYDLIDNEWLGFECVARHEEKGRIIFEMVVAIDANKVIALFVEDASWLPLQIAEVLRIEANACAQP